MTRPAPPVDVPVSYDGIFQNPTSGGYVTMARGNRFYYGQSPSQGIVPKAARQWASTYAWSQELQEGIGVTLTGARISFNATVERKDNNFGFYKRPTKVEVSK